MKTSFNRTEISAFVLTSIIGIVTALSGSALAQPTVVGSTGVASVNQSSACSGQLLPGLRRGQASTSVTALQQSLAAFGYFNATATGYFGPITFGAVVSYQAANGLPTTGYFGPMTYASITAKCGNPSPSTVSFSADPTAGKAPLDVSFMATGVAGGSQYIIEYGDGTHSDALAALDVCMHLSDGTGGCPKVQANHTYATNGTYTATLEPYIACMWSNPRCMIATQSLASVTVSVSSTISNAPVMYSITPTTGPVGIQVTIDGAGFSGDNTVRFGSGAILHIPIASSIAITCTTDPNCHGGIHQHLVFTVPSSLGAYCPSGTMCPMYMQQIIPGSYNVSVQNADGSAASNAIPFVVTSGGSTN